MWNPLSPTLFAYSIHYSHLTEEILMPNWCHNTLTVLGDSAEDVDTFVVSAQPTEALVHANYSTDYHIPFEQFMTEFRASQPLTFASLVPEPSDDEYAAMDEAAKTTCRLCAGRGKRPVTSAEAAEWNCAFYPRIEPIRAFHQRRDCNGCTGTGRAVPIGSDAWTRWRLTNWGCKWEPLFTEPLLALAAQVADVELSTSARGLINAGTAAVYRFDTPWSPPTPFLTHTAKMFPTLEFVLSYGEPGCGFAGRVQFRGGELIDEEDMDVHDVLPDQDMWF